ncbi:hypothetical protein OAJ65_01620 [Flavobacteriales bacterium]|nr:hypothetical protein [Flavobacteriales bacterium]
MKKVIVLPILVILIFLHSCKEDDLLRPVTSPTTIQTNDTLVLEGSKYRVTYSSFYLRNKYPICAIPVDTIVFEDAYNVGEIYFSNQPGFVLAHIDGVANQSGGYIISLMLATDYEQPIWNCGLAPGILNEQPMESYTLEDNKIIVRIYFITMNGDVMDYTITFDIVSYTKNTLIIENRRTWFVAPNPAIGSLGMDCVRTVRFELEKIN